MNLENPFNPPQRAATTITKGNTMTENTNSNSKLTATYKGGSGFDAPWIVHHADTPQEILDTLDDPAFKELFEKVQAAGQFFAGLGKPAQPTQAGGRAPRQGQPAASASVELSDKDWDKIEKETGSREIPAGWEVKSGIGKSTGKPWRAVMPPRGTDAKAIWL